MLGQAEACERWAREAQALDDSGRPGSAHCLRRVAENRASAALAAVQDYVATHGELRVDASTRPCTSVTQMARNEILSMQGRSRLEGSTEN